MAVSQVERYTDRQQQRTVVVWGCGTHRTPRGEVCQGCLGSATYSGGLTCHSSEARSSGDTVCQ
jgi:hypothetical protein